VGCSNGEISRLLDRELSKSGYNISILGIDIDPVSLEIAREMTSSQNINYKNIDIYSEEFINLKPDIVVTTLTLHHFTYEQINKFILNCFTNNAPILIINDLHRNILAYRLFNLFGIVTKLHPINRNDGKISILRGFRRDDMNAHYKFVKKKIPKIQSLIKWKWAFRYLWILKIYER